MKRNTLDSDDVIARYVSGQSLHAIMKGLHVRRQRVEAILRAEGIPLRTPSEAMFARLARMTETERDAFTRKGRGCIEHLDATEVVTQYVNGASKHSLTVSYGVHERVIHKILIGAGVLRSQSEAEIIKVSQMSAEQRNAMATRMHEGLRRNGRPPRWRINQALSFQRNLSRIGRMERELGQWLTEAGLVPIPQLAIDKYNVDLGLLPVTVELFCSPAYPLHRPSDKRRTEYMLDRGYHVFYVWATARHWLHPRVIDDLITFCKTAHTDPTGRGQYRVIRGCGELVSEGRGDFDQVTIKPSFRCAFDNPVHKN